MLGKETMRGYAVCVHELDVDGQLVVACRKLEQPGEDVAVLGGNDAVETAKADARLGQRGRHDDGGLGNEVRAGCIHLREVADVDLGVRLTQHAGGVSDHLDFHVDDVGVCVA